MAGLKSAAIFFSTPIKIDPTYSTISLSIKDLASLISPGEGGGVSFALRADLGRKEHQKRQNEIRHQHSDFDGEYQLSYSFHLGNFTITLKGRPDAVYKENSNTVIEEIKTIACDGETFQRHSLETLNFFRAQLDLYCYLARLQGLEPLRGRLYLVNVAVKGEKVIDYQPDFGKIAYEIETAFSRLIAEVERLKQRKRSLEYCAQTLAFPFPDFRPYQEKMMQTVNAVAESGGRLLLSAPTGSGKTAGVLFPTLISAFKTGKRVFFATARTTQRHIVYDFIQRLKLQDAPFSALFLTALAKLCPLNLETCEWEECVFIANFQEKFLRTGLLNELHQGAIFDADNICARALPVKLCPFAVSIQLAENADLIVGDFNYVFDPAVSLKKLFLEGGAGDFILIIDEAHNLPDRVRGYYSPEISGEQIQELLASIKGKSYQDGFFKKFSAFLRKILKMVHRLSAEPGMVELNLNEINDHYQLCEHLTMNYFLQMAQFGGIPSGDPILKFLHDFAWFCKVAEMGPEGFATVFPTESEVLKILCLDPGPRLREIMASFHSVIAMSATLQPAEFFAHLLGLDQNLECLTLPYPFPMENRQIRIFGQVSTLYKFRSRFARQVAEIIDNTYNEMPGGYFAFFPSYAYMKEVAQYLKSPLLVQNSEMSEEARSEFLQEVAKGGKVFLAVLGGIFAEGVDYPGQLNGVIVVGPGLPLYCLETELQRQYYDEIYGQGFNYAYVFPGMNRVIQAAGRLIRSENDRGTITLIDARFLQEPYRSLIPRDWYVEEVEELRIEKLKAKDEKLKTRV